jgi:TonB-like protein
MGGVGRGTGGGVGTGVGVGINGGVLNGKATTLPLPEYPEIARQAKASGALTVQVTIDEGGNVISANVTFRERTCPPSAGTSAPSKREVL